MMNMPINRKVIVIALDGVTFDLVIRWAQEGHLPNIKNLLKEASYGKINSTNPPISIQAWSAFMTGKGAGETRIFDYVQRDLPEGGFRCPSSKDIKTETIWDKLNKFDKRTGVLFFPLTYPVNKLNGFMISGLLTPSYKCEKVAYPEGLLRKYNVDTDLLSRGTDILVTKGDYDHFLDISMKQLKEKARIALETLNNESWDLFMVHFFETDAISHAMWGFMNEDSQEKKGNLKEAILNAYKQCDSFIGQVEKIAKKNSSSIIILSDHGTVPVRSTLNINNLLKADGLLRYRELNSSIMLLTLCEKMTLKYKDNIILRTFFSLSYSLINLIYNKLLFRSLKNIVDYIFLKIVRFLPSGMQNLFSPFQHTMIDWGKTQAYSVGSGGGIWINLKGKYPQGMVELEDYNKIRERIISIFEGLKDKNGYPIVRKVHKKEGLYNGKYVNCAPDLIIDFEGVHFIYNFFDNSIVSKPVNYVSGNHSHEGVFILKDHHTNNGKKIEEALDLKEVSNIIYYLMGVSDVK